MKVPDVSRGLRRAGLLAVLAGALLPGCESRTPPHRFPLTTPPATDSVPPPEESAARPASTEATSARPASAEATSSAQRLSGEAGSSARPASSEATRELAAVAAPSVVPASASVSAPARSTGRSAFRALPPTTERAGHLHALATRLKAPGGAVEAPCLEPRDTGCARSALTPFFSALDGLLEGTAKTPTVVAAFGNSLIAGDRIVDVVRDELTAGFGNAGRGALLVDRMAPYGGRSRTAAVSNGWQPRTLGELRAPPHPFGITGVYHVATGNRARGRFKLDGEPRGTLWWKDVKGAGRLVVSVDGAVLARTEPQGDGASRTTSFDLPAGAKWLDVTAEGKGAIVQGVVLQQDAPGIVLDMLGVPSADATLYGRLEEDALKSQLQQRDPKLLLFFLGGNESKRLEWKRTDLPTVRQDLAVLLRRARAAAPGSACMVVGPMDAVQDGHAKGKPLKQRPFLEAAIQAEREVALAEGCGFFNLYTAMGGAGSLVRFHQAGFMHDDLVHPRGQGLDLLGQLVADALLAGWVNEGAVSAPALTSSREDAPAGSGSGQTAEAVP
ncbi:GDSL-type esterase/lipase family protein [Corallococcus exercitus]|uniref:GDSL-type esterase/lipase family protein n=1 Tax=Corallococcus exercitus TaxID=2316736 RepID=UPI0035D52B6D